MAIEFHCSKCQRLIRAPDTSGGRRGKCPYCKESVYIPAPSADLEEIPIAPIVVKDDEPETPAAPAHHEDPYDLAPLDTEEEARDRRLREESARFAAALDKEEPAKYDVGAPVAGSESAPALPRDFELDVADVVRDYLVAMSASEMDRADDAVRQLKAHAAQAKKHVQQMMVDELPPANLGDIPVAVYKGFLRTLLKRL